MAHCLLDGSLKGAKYAMPTQRYSVTTHPIETLLTWVKYGEIAIPEIQRPFVWEPTKVRNLLDSLAPLDTSRGLLVVPVFRN